MTAPFEEGLIAMPSASADNIEQTQLVKAISEIASAMPLVRTRQLYQFARFLQGQPLSAEEVDEVDELLWDKQFSETSDEALAALATAIEKEIAEGKTTPMFDESGEFTEWQSNQRPPHL